jgi:hypothetical protein
VVEVRVPVSYRARADEFLSLILHTPIDPSFPQERARRYAQAMHDQPALISSLTWCLEALGKPALPFMRDLYDAPEIAARMGVLRAAVGLQDARAAVSLQALARTGPPLVRADAIRMLGRLDAGPTVDLALRDLLTERELDIRVAAYEALAERAETIAKNQRWLEQARSGTGVLVEDPEVARRQRIALAGDTIQGVRRLVIADKFLLDIIPAGDPLIYITQQGTPRIAVFGEHVELPRPSLTSVWSGRLMVAADTPTDDIRLYYQGDAGPGVSGKPGNSVVELIAFLAHTPSPEHPDPGLGMSYAQVVGALYALQQTGGIPAAFATEEDKLLTMLLKASQTPDIEERPETPDDRPSLRVYEPVTPVPKTPGPPEKPTLVEPLPPRTSSTRP